jgi:hypothetical protein
MILTEPQRDMDAHYGGVEAPNLALEDLGLDSHHFEEEQYPDQNPH